MKELTERQKAILKVLLDFIADNQYPPTRLELANELGITVNGVSEQLQAIERKGHIEIVPGISRGIKILSNDQEGGMNMDEELKKKAESIIVRYACDMDFN